MDTLAITLTAVGFFAIPIAIIMFIIKLFTKKSKKTPLILLIAGLVLLITGSLMTPATELPETETTQPVINPVVETINKGVLQYPASNENFKYNVYDTYVEITEYIGSQYASSITVPSNLENRPVYVVNSNVFNMCTVPTIVFQEGIYDIKSNFSTSVKSVTLPSTLKWIGSYQFKNCYALESIVIPEGIDTIMMGAFESCSSLKEVTIPSTVKTLGTGAFAYCTKLEKVNLSTGLLDIDEKVFVQCTALKYITLPESLTEIGSNAFQGTGLISVEIPASVQSVGARAFLACESITEIKFHNSDIQIKPLKVEAYGEDTNLFGQCNASLVVYGKPASVIANACAKENVYFQAF